MTQADQTRLDMLDADEAKRRAREVGVPEQLAELHVFRALLHSPQVAKSICDLILKLITSKHLEAELRELVIMRLGWLSGSVYEWTQHWKVALDIGMDEQLVLAVRDWRNADQLNAAQRAVLAATDETFHDGSISDATWAECVEHLGSEAALIELVAAIGNWRMVASILQSLHITLEEGTTPWPPDGLEPPPG